MALAKSASCSSSIFPHIPSAHSCTSQVVVFLKCNDFHSLTLNSFTVFIFSLCSTPCLLTLTFTAHCSHHSCNVLILKHNVSSSTTNNTISSAYNTVATLYFLRSTSIFASFNMSMHSENTRGFKMHPCLNQ